MPDAIDAWVRLINRQACALDEAAEAMHPSAWPEALAADMERFK